MEKRTCKACGERKLLSDFFLYDKLRGYRSRSCISCETNRRQALSENERMCKTCETEKPLTEFNISQGREGFRRHECKACESARKKRWYALNTERVKAKIRASYDARKASGFYEQDELRKTMSRYAKRHLVKVRDEVLAHYGGPVCKCCGEDEVLFMSLDHINNDGALRQQEGEPRAGMQLYQWLRKMEYPEGFQVLCFNCNLGKHRNGGVCPHQQGSTTSRKA